MVRSDLIKLLNTRCLHKTNLDLFVALACVYFYPRYKAYRKSNEDKSKFRCVSDTLGIGLPWKSSWTSGANSDSNLTEPLVDDSGDGGRSGHVI